MVKIIKIIIAFIIGTTVVNAQKDNPPPIVQIDTTVLAIGDQTHLRISLPVPKGKEAIFPDFKKKIGESLEIISKRIDTLKKEGNIHQITHDYTVTSFDTGYIYIPPFEIGIVEEGFNSTINTDSATLYVTYPIVDMQKGIFDIKPPADLPFKFKELIPYAKTAGIIILIIILISLILLYYFLIYKKKKNTPIAEYEDTRPADVKAIEALNILQQKHLWQNGNVKQYYSELTDIIRNYLDERFNMHTKESTSNEILTDIINQPVNNTEREYLAFIFEYADIAKFAKGQPLPDENTKSWINAKLFIEKTKEVIIIVEEGGLK